MYLCPVRPEAGHFNLKRYRPYTKKRGSLYLSLVPLFKASRIAHFVKDEQRRSPRRICVQSVPLYPRLRTDTMKTVWIHIPMGIYRCFVIRRNSKFARLWRVKRTKRLINAFSYMSSHPSASACQTASRWGCGKFTIYLWIRKTVWCFSLREWAAFLLFTNVLPMRGWAHWSGRGRHRQ